MVQSRLEPTGIEGVGHQVRGLGRVGTPVDHGRQPLDPFEIRRLLEGGLQGEIDARRRQQASRPRAGGHHHHIGREPIARRGGDLGAVRRRVDPRHHRLRHQGGARLGGELRLDLHGALRSQHAAVRLEQDRLALGQVQGGPALSDLAGVEPVGSDPRLGQQRPTHPRLIPKVEPSGDPEERLARGVLQFVPRFPGTHRELHVLGRVVDVAEDPRRAARAAVAVPEREPFQHQRATTSKGQVARRRGPHGTAAYDDRVEPIGHGASRSSVSIRAGPSVTERSPIEPATVRSIQGFQTRASSRPARRRMFDT